MTLLKVFLLVLPALFAKVELPESISDETLVSPYLEEQIHFDTNVFFDSRSFTGHEVELLGLGAWAEHVVANLGPKNNEIRLYKTPEGFVLTLKLESTAQKITEVVDVLFLKKIMRSFELRNGWSSAFVSDSFKDHWMTEYRQNINEISAKSYQVWANHPTTSAEQLKSCQLELH